MATITRLRASSTSGIAQIGAPDGPRCFTPVDDVSPLYVAAGMVWYCHSLEPSFADSATTAPWPMQHSNAACAPVATPDAESGTMILSL